MFVCSIFTRQKCNCSLYISFQWHSDCLYWYVMLDTSKPVTLTQPYHGSAPAETVWDFCMKSRLQWFCGGFQEFSHRSSLSSHHCSCWREKKKKSFNLDKIILILHVGQKWQCCHCHFWLLTSSWRASWRSSWSLLCPVFDSSHWRLTDCSPQARPSIWTRLPTFGSQSPGGVQHVYMNTSCT